MTKAIHEMNRDELEQHLTAEMTPPSEKKIIKLLLETNYDVLMERLKQQGKWGTQRHSWGDWLIILVEEVGELAQAMGATKNWAKPTDAQNLYEEAIQVAAVAQAIAEHIRWQEGF